MSVKNKSVSVVIPIYGSFDERRAVASVSSILNQKDVDLEVVISEQGIVPKFPSIDDSRVKHIFNKHIPQENLSDFNPGRVRNLAIEQSTKEFLYTNDADVVFLNEYFLSKSLGLLEQDEFLSIKRPPMRRLPLDNFEKFWDIHTKDGIKGALSKLDFSQDYFATLDGILRNVKSVTKPSDENYNKTFVAYMEDFQRYLSDDSLKGQEPKIWTENKHCGGNLLRRKHFEEVGSIVNRL